MFKLQVLTFRVVHTIGSYRGAGSGSGAYRCTGSGSTFECCHTGDAELFCHRLSVPRVPRLRIRQQRVCPTRPQYKPRSLLVMYPLIRWALHPVVGRCILLTRGAKDLCPFESESADRAPRHNRGATNSAICWVCPLRRVFVLLSTVSTSHMAAKPFRKHLTGDGTPSDYPLQQRGESPIYRVAQDEGATRALPARQQFSEGTRGAEQSPADRRRFPQGCIDSNSLTIDELEALLSLPPAHTEDAIMRDLGNESLPIDLSRRKNSTLLGPRAREGSTSPLEALPSAVTRYNGSNDLSPSTMNLSADVPDFETYFVGVNMRMCQWQSLSTSVAPSQYQSYSWENNSCWLDSSLELIFQAVQYDWDGFSRRFADLSPSTKLRQLHDALCERQRLSVNGCFVGMLGDLSFQRNFLRKTLFECRCIGSMKSIEPAFVS